MNENNLKKVGFSELLCTIKNDLLLSIHRLSNNELIILSLILDKIPTTADGVFSISRSELVNKGFSDLRFVENLKRACKLLSTRCIATRDNDTISYINFVSAIYFNDGLIVLDDDIAIRLRFTNDMLEYLSTIDKYIISNIFEVDKSKSFSNIYVYRLYMVLLHYIPTTNHIIIPLDDFKSAIGVSKGYLSNSNLKAQILDVACEQIRKYTPYYIDFRLSTGVNGGRATKGQKAEYLHLFFKMPIKNRG